jgi:hypothetical protein
LRNIVDTIGDSVSLRRDLLRLLVGDPIAEGCHREVYALYGRPDAVLKVEAGESGFYNVLEWQAWCELQDSKWAKFFAPCLEISANGSCLVQERTHPVAELPKLIPPFLQDVKPANFGMLKDGRVVCHDYSISWLIRSNLRGMAKREPIAPLAEGA